MTLAINRVQYLAFVYEVNHGKFPTEEQLEEYAKQDEVFKKLYKDIEAMGTPDPLFKDLK